MNLRASTVIMLLGLFLALPAPRTAAQDAPGGTDGPQNGLAACVRGRVITIHEVEKEAARLQKRAPKVPWKDLMWYARSGLAERIILAETAKRAASQISDDAIRREFTTNQGMELNYVLDNFEALKEDLLIDLYLEARLGKIDWLGSVVPDMAFFIRVTPDEIRSYYRNNPEEYTIPGRSVLLRVLFPATAFLDPGLRREAAGECARLLQDPASMPLDGTGDLKIFRERWPGCLPKTETIIEGEDTKFLPPVMEFLEKADTGAVSKVIELEGGFVVVRVNEKTETRIVPFDEIQDRMARELPKIKEENARRLIVEDLKLKEKVYWPPDLFEKVPSGGNQGAKDAGREVENADPGTGP